MIQVIVASSGNRMSDPHPRSLSSAPGSPSFMNGDTPPASKSFLTLSSPGAINVLSPGVGGIHERQLKSGGSSTRGCPVLCTGTICSVLKSAICAAAVRIERVSQSHWPLRVVRTSRDFGLSDALHEDALYLSSVRGIPGCVQREWILPRIGPEDIQNWSIRCATLPHPTGPPRVFERAAQPCAVLWRRPAWAGPGGFWRGFPQSASE